MIRRIFTTGLLVSVAAFAACAPVTGDRILGSDLVAAEPALAALPASLVVGFAPAPGEQRIFKAAELTRIAKSNGVAAGELSDICFELAVKPVTREEIEAAMTAVLPASAHLEILEVGRAEAPEGKIDFPLSGMEPADITGARIWRGAARYSNTRRMPLWAKVRLLEEYTAVIATRDLAVGENIDKAWLRAEKQTGPLPREPLAKRVEDVQGRIVKRALRAGVPIPASALSAPLSVRRGETVRVEVASGWARLHFEAVAEADAREGELVSLRNPLSGKTFRARVDGNGKATIVVGGAAL